MRISVGVSQLNFESKHMPRSLNFCLAKTKSIFLFYPVYNEFVAVVEPDIRSLEQFFSFSSTTFNHLNVMLNVKVLLGTKYYLDVRHET